MLPDQIPDVAIGYHTTQDEIIQAFRSAADQAVALQRPVHVQFQ